MARTYSLTDLNKDCATSSQSDRRLWCLAKTRALLLDKPGPDSQWPAGSLTDEEIYAEIDLLAVTDDLDSEVYYFPHKVASSLMRRPDAASKMSIAYGFSVDLGNISEKANDILMQGRPVNRKIAKATNNRVGTSSVSLVL